MTETPSEEAVLSFVRDSIKSAWALELLLLVRQSPGEPWSIDAAVREMRGSVQLVEDSVARLAKAGLVVIANYEFTYQPASSELAELVSALPSFMLRSRLPCCARSSAQEATRSGRSRMPFALKKGDET